MGNPQLIQEDEIDLREYIKVIIKRRKFILSFFAIVLLAAVLFSFITPRVYKATATIMITPSVVQSVFSQIKGLPDIGKSDAAVDGQVPPWGISIATHMNLLRSNIVLQRTVEKLNLKDASGKDLTIEDLSKKLNVRKATGENVIELEAADINPQKAQEIANTWSWEYTQYNQALIFGEVDGIVDVELRNKEDALLELKKQIATQKQFTILSKAMSDDAFWQASFQENNFSGLYKKSLRSQVTNPIYQDLETRIVNGEIEVNTLKTMKKLQLGDVRIVSPASIPNYPVSQGKIKTVVLAGILSLVLGVFLGFFIEFWQKE